VDKSIQIRFEEIVDSHPDRITVKATIRIN